MLRTTREVGLQLRQLREEAGMSQAELAEKANVSKRWIVNVENGKPSVDMLKVMDCFAVLGAGFEIKRFSNSEGDEHVS